MSHHVDELIAHPQRHFAAPREVLHDPRLTIDEKRKVLESWKLDAARLADSTAENMSGGEESDLREVSKILLELKNVEPTAFTPVQRPERVRTNLAGSMAIGALLGAGAGLVAVAITGPSLAIVLQTSVVGLILGGVFAGVRRAVV